MKSITKKEHLNIKKKLKPNFWYTPTVEEQSKLITRLGQFSDTKSIELLNNFIMNENEYIRELALKMLNKKKQND